MKGYVVSAIATKLIIKLFTRGYKREKQTVSHAIWIEYSFEMCDTKKCSSAEGEKSGKLE